MTRSLFGILAIIGVLPDLASAETLYGFAGRCQSLTLMDRAVSGHCEDTAYTARFSDGRIGYIFFLDDGTHVAFAWPARAQDASGEMTGEAGVDQIGFLVRHEVERIDAHGTCVTGKAYNTETTIICDATTSKGRFAAQFQTDGRRPKKLLGAPEPVGR